MAASLHQTTETNKPSRVAHQAPRLGAVPVLTLLVLLPIAAFLLSLTMGRYGIPLRQLL